MAIINTSKITNITINSIMNIMMTINNIRNKNRFIKEDNSKELMIGDKDIVQALKIKEDELT